MAKADTEKSPLGSLLPPDDMENTHRLFILSIFWQSHLILQFQFFHIIVSFLSF